MREGLRLATYQEIVDACDRYDPLCGEDEFDIDQDAQVSETEDGGGYWIQAWVWMPKA